jgi:endonuclease YncB( thermonuclease family)
MATFLTRSLDQLVANPPPPPTRVSVASITDGDTIRVILNGVNEPLRFIGIDTPNEEHSASTKPPRR